MTTLRPAYRITVGRTTLSRGVPTGPVALDVERSKLGSVGRVRLALGRASDLDVATADPVTIELGWEADTRPVFSGAVTSVSRTITGVVVTGAGTEAALVERRTDRTFVAQTAGDIVTAFAQDAGLDIGTVEAGTSLQAYVADSSRTAWGHCVALADLCGFDVYTDAAGALVFSAFAAGPPDETFRFGIDVLSARVERASDPGGVAVVPESPASANGDDAAAWLAKDPSPYRAEAGGTATLVRSAPALRTKDAATAAATGWSDRRVRDAVAGTVEVMGAPTVDLGGAVALDGLPDDAMNGTFQVTGVRHVLDRRRGFRTIVGLGGMPGSAGGSGGGAP